MSEVVHGETPQILPTSLLAEQFLFCWESKAAVPTKPPSLIDGDGKRQVSSNFVCPLLQLLRGIGNWGRNAGDLKGEGTISFLTPLSVIAERCRFLSILKNENFAIQAPAVIGNLNLCDGYTSQRRVRWYERTD